MIRIVILHLFRLYKLVTWHYIDLDKGEKENFKIVMNSTFMVIEFDNSNFNLCH